MDLSISALTRRQRKRQAAIAEILDAARTQIRRDGAAALNLNEVARQVGLRPPSLYEYFPGGRFEIYDALFRLGILDFGERMRPAYQEHDLTAVLRRSIDAYLRFAVEQPELFQICFERPVPGFVPSEESMRLSLGILNEGRDVVARLLPQSDNPLGLSVDQAQNLAIAVMHGIAALHVANEPHLPPGEGRFGSLVSLAAVALSLALPANTLPSTLDPGDAP